MISDYFAIHFAGSVCSEIYAELSVPQLHRVYSFLDYIMGGCQIHFTVSTMPNANERLLLNTDESILCLLIHAHFYTLTLLYNGFSHNIQVLCWMRARYVTFITLSDLLGWLTCTLEVWKWIIVAWKCLWQKQRQEWIKFSIVPWTLSQYQSVQKENKLKRNSQININE